MGRATRWLRSLLGGRKEDGGGGGGGYAAAEKREKKRWSFGKSGREPGEGPAQIRASTPEEAAWLRSVYAESEKEQSKHAIAVAAATAAAADAAVAAAQAAVAVVRLTSQGRSSTHRAAAVKIQTVFRAFLAKKALKALKALVKLQALVRGYLVRKQASATLHSMQALVRAQATVRAQRSRSNDRRLQTETRPRISHDGDDKQSEQLALSTHAHSQRLSSCIDSSCGFDRSPKIVEVDTCRPKSRSSRRSNPDICDELQLIPISSLLPPIAIPDCHIDYEWCLPVSRCSGRLASTAQSTPRCYMSSGNGPPTPAKSVSATVDGMFRRFMPNCPNYMANTQSFEAKVRSQSAPKQRPESVGGMRKRIPLSEMMVESRASLSAVEMNRIYNKGEVAFSFKNAVVSRMDRSLELSREGGRDLYLERKW